MNQVYVPPEGIKGFHSEILQGGEALIAVSSFAYPDADAVSNAIGHVHGIVVRGDLDGRWVTTQVAGGDIVTNEEIREVSTAFLSLKCL
jgi:hypothetical protein